MSLLSVTKYLSRRCGIFSTVFSELNQRGHRIRKVQKADQSSLSAGSCMVRNVDVLSCDTVVSADSTLEPKLKEQKKHQPSKRCHQEASRQRRPE